MDAVFATRRIGTDAVFAKLFYEASADHLITVADSQQINTASPASIQQTHLITIADSQQINTASSGAVTQTTTHYITIANAQQTNTASVIAIQQTHLVTANDSQQVNTASSGSIVSITSVGGCPISDADIARIATAVLAALQATAIPVNAAQMNGAPIIGDGSEANRWRGVGVPN